MPLIDGKVKPLELPRKHGKVLLDKSEPWRYRCLHGGRNGFKDWSVSAVAVEEAVRVNHRFLCTREVQKTIKDSIHQLLSDTIKRLGYEEYFEILDHKITCKKTGAYFIFMGLNDFSADNVKSLEGIDRVILGEAQNLTKKSWNILDPTIRKRGSEIWLIYNDQSETDFIYDLTVTHKPDNMICEKVSSLDGPKEWVSPEIRKQAERMKATNYELYEHIWLGKPGLGGRFFVEFGEHLRENAFPLEPSQMVGRLFGSLDSGTTHDTSFGFYWIEEQPERFYLHRLMTYCGNGMTIADHAKEIFDRLEAFPFTQGYFPDLITADPSMWTKVKLNEGMVRSPIDEYIDLFKAKGKPTRFEKANNDKTSGCQIMRMMFTDSDTAPRFRYFKEYNRSLEVGISNLIADENNLEIYKKVEGDDTGDDLRYGMIKGYSLIGMLRQRQVQARPKTHLEKVLAGHYRSKRATSDDWYNG